VTAQTPPKKRRVWGVWVDGESSFHCRKEKGEKERKGGGGGASRRLFLSKGGSMDQAVYTVNG